MECVSVTSCIGAVRVTVWVARVGVPQVGVHTSLVLVMVYPMIAGGGLGWLVVLLPIDGVFQ